MAWLSGGLELEGAVPGLQGWFQALVGPPPFNSSVEVLLSC